MAPELRIGVLSTKGVERGLVSGCSRDPESVHISRSFLTYQVHCKMYCSTVQYIGEINV